MTLYLTKLASLLVYPLTQAILLNLAGIVLLWRRHRRSALTVFVTGFLWLYLCSTSAIADRLMGWLEDPYPARAMSVLQTQDAIILLGGAVRGHTHTGRLPDLNEHADRVLHAAELYKAGKAPVILLSGGAAPDDRPEAEQMADILHVMGIPSAALLFETESRTTWDNALFSAQIARNQGWARVLLVTSAFHMRRAEAAFRGQGLDIVPAPTDHKRRVAESMLPRWLPSSGNLHRSSLALHEIVGYWFYTLQGKLATDAQVSSDSSLQ